MFAILLAAHRALRIYEILCEIIRLSATRGSLIHPDFLESPCLDPWKRAFLIGVAILWSAFYHPAMYLLWTVVDDAMRLLRILSIEKAGDVYVRKL